MTPLVSVIIPTYNRGHTIKRAVDSVYAGDYKKLEVIIVDDGSTDDTCEKVHELKNLYPNLSYVGQENKGVATARNQGVCHAHGDWIAFLDSDDEWFKTKLISQIELLKNFKDLKFVHTEEIWVREGVRVNPPRKYKKYGGDIFCHCLKDCIISPSTSLIEKKLFFELGGFREDFEVCEDYDFWLKLTSLNRVGFVDTPQIIKYGGHEDQLSQKYPAMDYWRVIALYDFITSKGYWHYIDQKKLALEVMKSKGEILLKGFLKYNRMDDYNRVRHMLLMLPA